MRAACDIEMARVLERLGLRAKTRKHRHLPRERRAQRIDGLDAQAIGAFVELPAQRIVALDGRTGEVPRPRHVRRIGPRRMARRAKRIEHALAHLGRRLDRERDRGDLLGTVDAGEEREEALDEELRLARARGRLHDERAIGVERALALLPVGRAPRAQSSSSAFLTAPNVDFSAMRQSGCCSHCLQVVCAALRIDARLARGVFVAERIELRLPLAHGAFPCRIGFRGTASSLADGFNAGSDVGRLRDAAKLHAAGADMGECDRGDVRDARARTSQAAARPCAAGATPRASVRPSCSR